MISSPNAHNLKFRQRYFKNIFKKSQDSLADSKIVTTFAVPFGKSQNEEWEDSLAQLVEHNTFNVGVSGSSPERVTKGSGSSTTKPALLAQLVEQLTLNQRVQGSSP